MKIIPAVGVPVTGGTYTGAVTFQADTTLAARLLFSAAAGKLVPGATSFSLRNNADSADNLIITDAGAATLRSDMTLAARLLFSAAAGKLVPGATSFSLRNNADSADNLIVTDAGVITTAIQTANTNSFITGDININTANQSLLKMGNIQVLQRTHATGAVLISTTGGNITLTPAAITTTGKAFAEALYAPAYSSSITPDASQGNTWTITATNGTAFTINAPTNPANGQRIELTIRNASGGTQGAVTFNAAFKTAGYTVAANGFSASASFTYDGTNWVQRGAWINTIPN